MVEGTVFLADGPYGLRLLDVSDPIRLTTLGSAYEIHCTFDVAASGHHACIAAAGAGRDCGRIGSEWAASPSDLALHRSRRNSEGHQQWNVKNPHQVAFLLFNDGKKDYEHGRIRKTPGSMIKM